MSEMLDHDALVIYLRDLRNLEVVKAEIDNEIEGGGLPSGENDGRHRQEAAIG